jgi:hypothetical protein
MMEEKINDDERLFVALQKLASVVKQAIEEAIADQKIKIEHRFYTPHKVGPLSSLMLKRYENLFLKSLKFKILYGELVEEITEDVKLSKEFIYALNISRETYKKDEDSLTAFSEGLIRHYLYEYQNKHKMDDSLTLRLISCFLKELKGEPLRHLARVGLDGIELEIATLKLAPGIVLRRPSKDIETEFPLAPLATWNSPFLQPEISAILEVEAKATNQITIMEKIDSILKTLKLFKVATIKPIILLIVSEAIIPPLFGEIFLINIITQPKFPYTIKQEDEERLKNFWKMIEKPLINLHSLTQIPRRELEHLFFANTFYEDALLREGRFEEKVTRVVMGLEALLLAEQDELSYRLSLRTAKLLGLLGFDAIDVKKRVSDAYKIRSKYAHGKLLPKNKEESITKKYGGQQAFLHSLLNYLRLLIITMLLCKIRKDKFLEILDFALIDQNQDNELKEKLSKAIEIVQEVKE